MNIRMKQRMAMVVVLVMSGLGVAFAAPPTKPVARRPAVADWSKMIVRTPDGGVRMGRPDAPVKLIEYGSRTCPHCALFNEEGLPQLVQGPIARGKLSYEFRDYPVHGAIDIGPILLGHCATPRQFFPLLDAMMRGQTELLAPLETLTADEQTQLGKQSPAEVASFLAKRQGYLDLAGRFGVTPARAETCLHDKAALAGIARSADTAARVFKLASTPSFVINGAVAADVHDWARLAPALKAKGAL